MALVPVRNSPGFVQDTNTGLLIPSAGGVRYNHPLDAAGYTNIRNGLVHSRDRGTLIPRDEHTGIPFWPAYASGFDDFLMRAMVQGYLGNTTQTPVAITLLATIVTKIQGMTGTWINTIRGKKSPVKKIMDIMSQADDSQFGAAEFVRNHIGALSVDNRGSICSQVPIGVIDFDMWDDYGMEAEPIDSRPASRGGPTMFALRMEPEQFRENRGLWSIDGLYCNPTGNAEYPYWIRKFSRQRKKDVWVLIHRDFGFQLIQQAGPKNSLYPGFGQSGAWRFSPYAIKDMVIQRQDWEHLMNQPMRGIVWVSGLDRATQFKDQLESYHQQLEQAEMFFYPGVFFGGSQGENSKITMLPWSEPPVGYTPNEWNQEVVSKLAASFHMNETHLQLKLGEGALTQSGVAESLEAETAIAWMRQMVETVWNHLAPARVVVRTIWHSDRIKRRQVDTWREMSLAISRLNKPNPNVPDAEKERLVYNREEIRALTFEFVGVEIPELASDEGISTDTRSGEDLAVRSRHARQVSMLYDDRYSEERRCAVGNVVIFRDDRHQYATITSWQPGSDWVWVVPEKGLEMLVSMKRLSLVAIQAVEKPRAPHVFKPGERVFVNDGVEATITRLDMENGLAYINFDWDLHLFADERPFNIEELTPMPKGAEMELV